MGEDLSAYDIDVSGSAPPSTPGSAALPVVRPALSPVGGAATPLMGTTSPFDGADRIGGQLEAWVPALRSADADILPDKAMLDGRVRDTGRNDAFVHGAATLHKDNIVGSQFRLNASPNFRVLGLDETWSDEFQEEVESLFTLWAESPDNWPDAARMNTLTGLVRLAVGIFAFAGETVATVEWLRDQPRVFSTALQMVDLDRLSNPPDRPESGTLRGGVQRNAYGAPLGYYFRKGHPFDLSPFTSSDSFQWTYVPVRKPWGRLQVIHIVEQERPDQTRGVSDLVSALKEIYITRKWRDVALQNAVVNSLFAATIESELPTEQLYEMLGAAGGKDASGAMAECASAFLTNVMKYGESARLKIDGVRIPHLFPGTKLNLNRLQGDSVGSEFEQSLLRYIAAATNVSYEQLSKDYSKTNYSSARAAMNETWKFMQSRKKFVADRFASAVYRLWLEEAINKKLITSLPRRAPSWYERMNADAYSTCTWIGASRGQIDEEKENKASALALETGLTTLEEEAQRRGKDWRELIRQRAREKKALEAAGLTPEKTEKPSAKKDSVTEDENDV